jgi:GMP synthase-like glutamine amidotransferase
VITPARTVVVREYQPDAPAGLLGEWLDARRIAWRVSRPADEPEPPEVSGEGPSPTAIVALGSSASAYWTEPPWIARECELLAAADGAGVPVLGICFGAQALARGLGGRVARSPRPELGWVAPTSLIAQLRGPYLAWHLDLISPPPDAEVLARTGDAIQAYARGRALGLQFHPEVTAEIWGAWASVGGDELAAHVTDPAALAASIVTSADATRVRVFALLDWWWARLGQLVWPIAH